MSKLKPEDKEIILLRWHEAWQALKKVAESTELYIEQPEHDKDLVQEIGEALREAVLRKFDSLMYFPKYKINEHTFIRFLDLYTLFNKLREIEGDVEFRRRHNRVNRILDELLAMLGGLLELEWVNPECRASWEHLQHTIRHVKALISVDGHIGAQLPNPNHFLVVAAYNIEAARKVALLCIGDNFPYTEFLWWIAEVDRTMERAATDIRELPGEGGFWGPDPNDILGRANAARDMFETLESKLNKVPLEGG